MKFVSFNINGLRAHFHQLEAIIMQLQPDIIALQETKVHNNDFPVTKILNFGYNVYYIGQKKYYGVALICKKKIYNIKYNLYTRKNTQTRIILGDIKTKYGILSIINGYFPQGDNKNNITKFNEKKLFYKYIKHYITNYYNKDSLLIVMGDMNISPTDLDIGIGKKNHQRWLKKNKCSFLPEERKWINDLFKCNLIDIYRYIYPTNKHQYSWFDYRSKGFQKNRGLRIDLLLASHALIPYILTTGISYEIRSMNRPSDHAPVWAEFAL